MPFNSIVHHESVKLANLVALKFYFYFHVRPAYNLTLLNSHRMQRAIIRKYVEDF